MQDLNGKKAVIYARQSFGHEENSASIEEQLNNCRKWCEQHGIVIVGEFSDKNTSSELYDDSIEGHAYAATDAEWQKWDKGLRDAKSTRNTSLLHSPIYRPLIFLLPMNGHDFIVIHRLLPNWTCISSPSSKKTPWHWLKSKATKLTISTMT